MKKIKTLSVVVLALLGLSASNGANAVLPISCEQLIKDCEKKGCSAFDNPNDEDYCTNMLGTYQHGNEDHKTAQDQACLAAMPVARAGGRCVEPGGAAKGY